ncbi:Peptide deformylase 1B, chloroplastic/mitochondrial [Vitis vinifera]|uniref:Peptide deformylase n=1 Tax=Vitis vinifera TaxID=29760 RepID=A0A438EFR0_VITVI|nr:Peptide deformylase 1B, chloroplastic/mitochondrial [Vitis vinifera]RVX08927.1 Peptide deformylase 1B, chloroplastic/mitochondrial [Vitis vinifera]
MKLKILSWNVRRANDREKRKLIKSIIMSHKVDLRVLNELNLISCTAVWGMICINQMVRKGAIVVKTDGIGLSAPQVGINVQLMVFNPVGERGEGEEIVLVNPRVNKYSKKIVLFNEGCLSFPGIYADVERPESVKIDARDITGARFMINLSGLPARVFQHEFDHLQGTLFFDRMTEEVLDSIHANLQVS